MRKKIAKKLNKQHKEVQIYIKENNFSLKHEIFTNDKISRVCELYKAGVSAKQLGKKFNIDKRRVQKWVSESGLLRISGEANRFTEFNQHKFV